MNFVPVGLIFIFANVALSLYVHSGGAWQKTEQTSLVIWVEDTSKQNDQKKNLILVGVVSLLTKGFMLQCHNQRCDY